MINKKALNIRKIKPLIEEVVEQKLYDMLGDPDEGLKLKSAVRKKLMALGKKQKGISAKKAAAELGLKW